MISIVKQYSCDTSCVSITRLCFNLKRTGFQLKYQIWGWGYVSTSIGRERAKYQTFYKNCPYWMSVRCKLPNEGKCWAIFTSSSNHMRLLVQLSFYKTLWITKILIFYHCRPLKKLFATASWLYIPYISQACRPFCCKEMPWFLIRFCDTLR